MNHLAERITKRHTLLLDGALGTMLLQRGLRQGECPESVNMTRPQVLGEIARLYAEAGADILETNTFGASPLRLAQHGLEDRMQEINEAAVLAVREAVGQRAFVAACCGPSGRLLKPHGDVEPGEVYAGFRKQMQCLIGAGVDAICIETMTDLREATLAVQAAKDVSAAIPVLATMTFDRTPRGFFTIMGTAIDQAASALGAAGADAIGSNCGNGIENMIAIAREFSRCTELPLVIQANAGLPETSGGATVYAETPDFVAGKTGELLDAGVSLIGGCCGTTPEHIRALRARIDAAETVDPDPGLGPCSK